VNRSKRFDNTNYLKVVIFQTYSVDLGEGLPSPEDNPIPGAVIAVQTIGDFLGFNPHCRILVADGCFCADAKSTSTSVNPHSNSKQKFVLVSKREFG